MLLPKPRSHLQIVVDVIFPRAHFLFGVFDQPCNVVCIPFVDSSKGSQRQCFQPKTIRHCKIPPPPNVFLKGIWAPGVQGDSNHGPLDVCKSSVLEHLFRIMVIGNWTAGSFSGTSKAFVPVLQCRVWRHRSIVTSRLKVNLDLFEAASSRFEGSSGRQSGPAT